VREFSTPLTVEIPATGNLTDDVVANARDAGSDVVFSRRTGAGWEDVTAAGFLDEVSALAKGLIAAGVEAGDRVALISKTRYEWTLVDYAIWFAGAVTVPVYETSSAEQLGWILRDSGARAVVAEGPGHLARLAEVRGDLDDLNHVWSLDDNAVGVLTRLGADISDEELEKRRSATTPLDLATLIYTSGTTGRPKGCMLTHGNFMFELGVAVEELDELFLVDGASTLLFLPLAHVFARIIQVGCVKKRVRMGHSADIKNLVVDLGEFRPTFVLAVPRVFEKVFNTASQRATADGRGKIFDRAAETAIAYSRGLDKGRPSLSVRAQHAVFSRLVYGKLRDALGGRCTYAVSGGAPLGDRLGHFYRGIGLSVLEGYGLTETTAALTVNLPDATKIGTVGRPRTWRRPCSRTGSARTRWSARSWWSATASRSSPPWSPSTPRRSRCGRSPTGSRRAPPTWSTIPTCARRSRPPWRRPTRRSPRPSRSASSRSSRRTGPRRADSSRRA
jgi:long-chain acyl-CoA synthetase